MFPKYTFSKAGGAVLMLVSIRGLVLGNLEILLPLQNVTQQIAVILTKDMDRGGLIKSAEITDVFLGVLFHHVYTDV